MATDKLQKAHLRLLDDIDKVARQTENFTGRRKFSDRVMAAMARVPRHQFVAPQDADFAYLNRPRGIGFGQTISQPYIVALMTDLLDLDPADTVLEIGTGSGYQAAVLAGLCERVYSVEKVAALAETAAERLRRLGYHNVHIRHGDGYLGWPEAAPFEAIIVTAAPQKIPAALCEQLKPEGRIIAPVGPAHGSQMLKIGRKDSSGKMHFSSVLPVAFVPMLAGPVVARPTIAEPGVTP